MTLTLNEIRHFATSVTMSNDDQYIIGGENSHSSLPLSTAEKLTRNGFEVIDMKVKLSRHCAIPYNDTTIFLIGGIVNEEQFSDKTYFFNPTSKEIEEGPSLMKGRQLHSCGKLGRDKQQVSILPTCLLSVNLEPTTTT